MGFSTANAYAIHIMQEAMFGHLTGFFTIMTIRDWTHLSVTSDTTSRSAQRSYNEDSPDRGATQAASSQEPIRICILGAGFAGLYTALQLSRSKSSRSIAYEIVLVDRNDRFLFTPLFYELLTGELQRWEIAPPYLKLLAGTGVQFRCATVTSVELDHRQVQLHDGTTLFYDYLVLAAGRETPMEWVAGASEYAYSFRSLADADRLMERLHQLQASQSTLRVVIAGGGANGVELGCKIADLLQGRAEIHLIERGTHLLKTFTRFSQRAARRALEFRGVQIHLETSLEAIEADHILYSANGQTHRLPTDLVIWAVGTQSHPWIEALPCQQTIHGRLSILPTLQLSEYPDVFALGDVAELRNARGNLVPATAQAAYQKASCAAYNLLARLNHKPLRRFSYLHLGEMMTLGVNDAVVSSFCFNFRGSLAFNIRKWVYLQRMPTLHHQLEVARHWFAVMLTGLGNRVCKLWQCCSITGYRRSPTLPRRSRTATAQSIVEPIASKPKGRS